MIGRRLDWLLHQLFTVVAADYEGKLLNAMRVKALRDAYAGKSNGVSSEIPSLAEGGGDTISDEEITLEIEGALEAGEREKARSAAQENAAQEKAQQRSQWTQMSAARHCDVQLKKATRYLDALRGSPNKVVATASIVTLAASISTALANLKLNESSGSLLATTRPTPFVASRAPGGIHRLVGHLDILKGHATRAQREEFARRRRAGGAGCDGEGAPPPSGDSRPPSFRKQSITHRSKMGWDGVPEARMQQKNLLLKPKSTAQAELEAETPEQAAAREHGQNVRARQRSAARAKLPRHAMPINLTGVLPCTWPTMAWRLSV